MCSYLTVSQNSMDEQHSFQWRLEQEYKELEIGQEHEKEIDPKGIFIQLHYNTYL